MQDQANPEDAGAHEACATYKPGAWSPARLLNWIVAVAFTVGGSLFALGAAIAQTGSGDPTASASIYLAGGLFFSTGGYGSLLQGINPEAPRGGGGWRWWSYEPMRTAWLAPFLLFAGTLVFGVGLISAFLEGLTVRQQNHLIWAPDITGCVLFLLSGRLGLVALRREGRRLASRDLEWWTAAVNQVGSILFFISGVAAFTRPETGSMINVAIANWGTFGGALCFASGGVLQAFQRPRGPSEASLAAQSRG